jgi:hypothetical protein
MYSIVLCRPAVSQQLREGLESLEIESWEAKASVLVRRSRSKSKKTKMVSVLPGFVFVKSTPSQIISARDQSVGFLPAFRFLMLRGGPARVSDADMQLFINALQSLCSSNEPNPPKFRTGQIVSITKHQWLSGLRASVVSQKGSLVKLAIKELNITLKISAFFLICSEAQSTST